jgi:hypothetical protein
VNLELALECGEGRQAGRVQAFDRAEVDPIVGDFLEQRAGKGAD